MKARKSAKPAKPAAAPTAPVAPATPAPSKIHPVVIYPFRTVTDYSDLQELYSLVAKLAGNQAKYARPITVMDRKTYNAASGLKEFQAFRAGTVARHSDILDAWCVDTCQMWNTGLGAAWERGGPDDVYWLIPGDFNYGTGLGREVLGKLRDLPEIIAELRQDFCVGEITTDHNDAKQLIDTYGTFALLYTWFPQAARQIREVTERPRSEFFAIRHGFLGEVLHQRWYPYEQTLVMLLIAATSGKRVSRFSVGDITDLPHGTESLDSAVQQVERTERVIKMFWREHHRRRVDWFEQYRQLEVQSDQVRRTAGGILRNLLG